MNRYLVDLRANIDNKQRRSNSSIVAVVKVLLDINFLIVTIFRCSSICCKLKLYPIAKILWLLNRIVFTVDLDPRADIAGGLVGIHFQNVVIGHEVKSLGPMSIYQGVTIGGNMGKRALVSGLDTGQPVIASGVIIGINACVLGPITIGEKTIVGAGAIVTQDVPPYSLVLGVNNIKAKGLG